MTSVNKVIAELDDSDKAKIRDYIKNHIIGNVAKLEDDACWIPINAKKENGYVRIRIFGANHYLHRLSYAAYNGNLKSGMDICHSCDVRNCCNPKHLFQGSRKENMQDCAKKGRLSMGAAHAIKMRIKRGCLGIKLTQQKADMIRQMIASGKKTKDVANEFQVDVSMVRLIVLYKAWVPSGIAAHASGAI